MVIERDVVTLFGGLEIMEANGRFQNPVTDPCEREDN